MGIEAPGSGLLVRTCAASLARDQAVVHIARAHDDIEFMLPVFCWFCLRCLSWPKLGEYTSFQRDSGELYGANAHSNSALSLNATHLLPSPGYARRGSESATSRFVAVTLTISVSPIPDLPLGGGGWVTKEFSICV